METLNDPAAEARRLVYGPTGRGPDRAQSTPMLRNMIKALSLHPWLNDADDKYRLRVAIEVLALRHGHGKGD